MCNCIDESNKLLSEQNATLSHTFIGPRRVIIATLKKDDKKRGRPPVLAANFCPFCGEKYPEMEGGAS
ncbi:MAG: hypothetical protein AB7D00_14510 [Rhodospirillaceae bacterium]